MSIIGSNILAGASGQAGAAAYEIEQSLRFNSGDTHYLNRTPGSAGNRQVFTISFWIKRSALGGKDICTGDDQNGFLINFQTGDALYLYDPNAASGGFQIWSARVFRDTSAWYHIVVAVDSTQATDSNRVKVYINGEQENLATWNVGAGASRYPTQNANLDWNNTNSHEIGTSNNYGYLDGYLSEFYNIDGSALDADNFGEPDDNGVWRPIQTSGLTYGTNGFYLKFDPSATNGIGHDHSGNGNNFTANNFTTSGTGTDVMSDTPTTNYATMNPLRPSSYGSVTLSNGNLNASQSTTAYEAGIATIGVSSGKWYWEVYCNSVGFVTSIGITKDPTANGPTNSGNYTYHYDGVKYTAGTATGYGASYTSGDLLGFALDLDAGTLVAYKNGTSQGTLQTGLSGTFYPYVTLYGTHNVTFNFGQRAFEQTVPTGYSALNTSNLPEPDIADGSDYFDTLTYTGDGLTPKEINGLEFQPDFVWIKDRSASTDHILTDAVRGATKNLVTNNTTTENTNAQNLQSFDDDGFTIGNASQVNLSSGRNYVAWNWLAGGSGSSNTDGSATNTVTVSASPTAGFSIVTYSGQTSNFTWGHGLGVPPSMVIIKGRTNTSGWSVYHKSLGATKRLQLDQTGGEETMSYFQNTEPTSTVFSVTTNGGTGANGVDYIAYCFAEVEGYSKFGSYEGNNNDDNVFIYLGFTPAFVMIKNADAVSNWIIHDTTRDTYNPSSTDLYPNTSGAEPSYEDNYMDFLSNGIKIRDTSGPSGNSNTYIYAAFASNPFGGSGVSPATAR
jgi:hypothetical protein